VKVIVAVLVITTTPSIKFRADERVRARNKAVRVVRQVQPLDDAVVDVDVNRRRLQCAVEVEVEVGPALIWSAMQT
jgi:hypothetical protein